MLYELTIEKRQLSSHNAIDILVKIVVFKTKNMWRQLIFSIYIYSFVIVVLFTLVYINSLFPIHITEIASTVGDQNKISSRCKHD